MERELHVLPTVGRVHLIFRDSYIACTPIGHDLDVDPDNRG